MKKLLIFAIITTILLPSIAFSQAALLVLLLGDKVASENFYFSIKLGGNYATLSGIDDTDYKLGLNFGLVATIKLSDNWYIVPEFLPLSNKGVKDVPVLPTGNPDLDALLQDPTSTARNLNYIDIPVLVRYKINEKFGIGAGPQISILTDAIDTYKAELSNDEFIIRENEINSELNPLDVAAVFDIYYSVSDAREGKGLNIHARLELGITDIVKNNPGDAVRNTVFQIALELPFIE